MEFKISPHGIEWRYDNFFIFFGNKKLDEENFGSFFPDLKTSTLRQVHGDHIIPVGPVPTGTVPAGPASTLRVPNEADGHYTGEANLALLIRTADCLPIFGVDPLHKKVIAIHAGWRGVVGEISMKAVRCLQGLGGRVSDFHFVLGPHIRTMSFEVDKPVWAQLMDAIPVEFHHLSQTCYEKSTRHPNKYLVDLESIVRFQLESTKLSSSHIHRFAADTYSDDQWHSYRREAQSAGRNISFGAYCPC